MDTKQKFKKLLGHNLRRVRVDRRLSVEKLALEAGLAYSQVSRIELGKISTSAFTIYMLARTLEVSPAVFFDSINIENREQLITNNKKY